MNYQPGLLKAGFTAFLASLAVVAVALPGPANAALLFDRGLPTINLNNDAAPGRSNVQWADTESTNVQSTFWRPGDDFTLTGTGAYNINTIRVWSTDNKDTGLSLLGGLVSGTKTVISSTYSKTGVTYANGQGYQDQGLSPFKQMYQLDFSVNIALNGGETFQFFLDGPAIAWTGGFRSTLLHASNALQSGSTQQGADGTFLFLNPTGSVETFNSFTGVGTFCPTPCPGAWDKVSDGNVQVFGVPEPASLALLGLGLAGLGFSRRKRAS